MDYRSLQGMSCAPHAADDTVQCPICARSFTAADLNTHLDMGCDPSSSSPSPAPDPFAHAKRLTRPQYQLKSEKDLRKMLGVRLFLTQSLGLPTQGPKDRLIERHRQWVNVYNANLDASPANRESLERLRRNLLAWDRNQDEVGVHAKDRVSSEKQYRSWLVCRPTYAAYPSQPVCGSGSQSPRITCTCSQGGRAYG